MALTWNYPLNEGAGTDIINVDPSTQGNYNNLPLYDTTAMFGNGTRYGQLDQPITLGGDWTIEFDLIYSENISGTAFCFGSGGGESYIYIVDSGSVTVVASGTGGSTGEIKALNTGDHIRFSVSVVSGQCMVDIDGVSGSPFAIGSPYVFDQVWRNSGQALQADGALQNIVITDITQGLTYTFPLDEGSGTVINNTDPTTGDSQFPPISDTTALMGDGARYIDIPAFTIGANDDFDISWDWIYGFFADNFNIEIIGDIDRSANIQVGGPTSSIPDGISYKGANGPSVAIGTTPLAGLVTGQHVNIRVTRTGDNYEAFVNGVSGGVTVDPSPENMTVSQLYGGTANPVPASSAMQNVTLHNTTTGDYVQYRIDEGSGSDILAYDINGQPIGLGPEGITNGAFDTNVDGWEAHNAGGDASVLSWDNGRLKLVFGTSADSAASNLAFTLPGLNQETYLLEFDWEVEGWGAFNLLLVQAGPAPGTGAWGGFGNITINSASASGSYSKESSGVGSDNIATWLNITAGGGVTTGVTTLWLDNVTIRRTQDGTVNPADGNGWLSQPDISKGAWTPDADWQAIPAYTNNGVWTPDAVWSEVRNNKRHYPMNEGGGNIFYDRADTTSRIVGGNLVTDGQFADPAAWDAEPGWLVLAGAKRAAHSGGGVVSKLTQPLLTTAGKNYQIEFTLSVRNPMGEKLAVGLGFGSPDIEPGAPRSVQFIDTKPGKKTVRIFSALDYTVFGFASTQNSEVIIQNVTMYEVRASDTDAVIQNYADNWDLLEND